MHHHRGSKRVACPLKPQRLHCFPLLSLHRSQEVDESHSGGGDAVIRPAEVLEMTHLSLFTCLSGYRKTEMRVNARLGWKRNEGGGGNSLYSKLLVIISPDFSYLFSLLVAEWKFCSFQSVFVPQLSPQCCAVRGLCGCSGCGGPPSGSPLPYGRTPLVPLPPVASTVHTSSDCPRLSCRWWEWVHSSQLIHINRQRLDNEARISSITWLSWQ